MIKNKVLELLSDEKEYSIPQIKDYLKRCEIEDYTEGQFSAQ